MKATRLLFLALAICLASGVRAQFSDSEQVYIYEYQYTINSSGVKTGEDNPNPQVYLIYFKNGCLVGWSSSKNEMREKGGISYFEEKVRKKFAEDYNKFYGSPQSTYGFPPTIFAFDNSLSKGDTYTYRQQKHYLRQAGVNFSGIIWQWNGTSWESQCYSFSIDKKGMIIWFTGKDFRHYYKLMDANAYKPNTDFTW